MGELVRLYPRPEKPKARSPVLDDLWVDVWPQGLVPILAAQCEKAGKEE